MGRLIVILTDSYREGPFEEAEVKERLRSGDLKPGQDCQVLGEDDLLTLADLFPDAATPAADAATPAASEPAPVPPAIDLLKPRRDVPKKTRAAESSSDFPPATAAQVEFLVTRVMLRPQHARELTYQQADEIISAFKRKRSLDLWSRFAAVLALLALAGLAWWYLKPWAAEPAKPATPRPPVLKPAANVDPAPVRPEPPAPAPEPAPKAPSTPVGEAPARAVSPTEAPDYRRFYTRTVIVEDGSANRPHLNTGSVGTAFIARIKGQLFLVTNIHVLVACREPLFTRVSGEPLPVDLASGYLAKKADVALFPLPDEPAPPPARHKKDAEPPRYFELIENLSGRLNIQDDIVVLGARGGLRVINVTRGNVQGVGADLIEITASLEPGDSGSPIIRRTTDEVIAVASFESGRRRADANRFRTFGFRLDTIDAWDPVGHWADFRAEADAFETVLRRTADLDRILNGKPGQCKDPGVQFLLAATLRDLEQEVSRRTLTSAEPVSARQRFLDAFLAQLGELVEEDLARPARYGYFERELSNQRVLRKQLLSDLQRDVSVHNVKRYLSAF